MSIFTDKDYKSADGMLTSIWGPPLWHVLHTISFNYPVKPSEEQKKHYYNFYSNIKNILPCKFCRHNLTDNLKSLPLTMNVLTSRLTLSRWVYDLHEIVNKMLHKKSQLSYCDVRERYEHFRSRCTEEKPKIFNFKKTSTRRKKEKGCTEPLYGKKSKCVINIVPQEDKRATLKIDKKCIKSRT